MKYTYFFTNFPQYCFQTQRRGLTIFCAPSFAAWERRAQNSRGPKRAREVETTTDTTPREAPQNIPRPIQTSQIRKSHPAGMLTPFSVFLLLEFLNLYGGIAKITKSQRFSGFFHTKTTKYRTLVRDSHKNCKNSVLIH